MSILDRREVNLAQVGPRELKDPRSKQYAIQTLYALKRYAQAVAIDKGRVAQELAEIDQYRHWEVLGYPSQAEMLKAEEVDVEQGNARENVRDSLRESLARADGVLARIGRIGGSANNDVALHGRPALTISSETIAAQQIADEWEQRVVDLVDGEPEEPTFVSLRELLDNPANLAAPIEVAHRFAYEARAVVVCAEDKAGKSTLMATGAAAVTRGRDFLGRPTFKGRVLWVGLEENVGDAVQRFHELDADPDMIELSVAHPADLLAKIRDRIAHGSPLVWVIVDSMSEYARLMTKGAPPSEGDTSGWSMVARPLVEIAHQRGVALTALHHVRRDGQERGSTELFASMDAVWVMSGPRSADEDPRTRHLRGRGRRGIDTATFSTVWNGVRYELVGGTTLSLDARVLLHVQANPGLGSRKLRTAVGGRANDIDRAVADLIRRGAIRNDGTDSHAKYVATDQHLEPRLLGGST